MPIRRNRCSPTKPERVALAGLGAPHDRAVPGVGHVDKKRLGRHRAGEIEALRLPAARRAQDLRVLFRLNALGDHILAEAAAEFEHG